MKNLLILVISLAFTFSCKKTGSVWVQTIPVGNNEALIAELADMTNPCNDSSNYIPDENNPSSTPLKRVKINVHVMQNAEGKGNLAGDWGKKYVEAIILSANGNLISNSKMRHPPGNNIPVIPARFVYKLWPTTYIPGDDGIYYHQDDELYFNINRGKEKNIFKREIFEKYGIQKDSVLNIFVQDVHLDSLNSSSFDPKYNGVAFSTWVKVANWYDAVRDTIYNNNVPSLPRKYVPPKLLNHEIGHVFNLRHAWRKDFCDDTPVHINCWSQGPPPCDYVSNNIMDYNSHMSALTPCQLGRVHMSMMTNEKKRALLIKDWCEVDELKNAVINKNTTWNDCKNIHGNIIIEPGARLVIRCKTAMPNRSKIVVKPGGELVLQGAHLYNDCGNEWLGIRSLKNGARLGKVSYIGNLNKVEHSKYPIALEGASKATP
jgi:hypothetical protein